MRKSKLYSAIMFIALISIFSVLPVCTINSMEKGREEIGEGKNEIKPAQSPHKLLELTVSRIAALAVEIYDQNSYSAMEEFLSQLIELKSKVFSVIINVQKRADIFIMQMLSLFRNTKTIEQPGEEKNIRLSTEEAEDELMTFFNEFSFEDKLELLRRLIVYFKINSVGDLSKESLYPLLEYLILKLNDIILLSEFEKYLDLETNKEIIHQLSLMPPEAQYQQAQILYEQIPLRIGALDQQIRTKLKESLKAIQIASTNEIKEFSQEIQEKANNLVQALRAEPSETPNCLTSLTEHEKEEIFEFLFVSYFMNNPSTREFIANLITIVYPNLEHLSHWSMDTVDVDEANTIFSLNMLHKISRQYPLLIEMVYSYPRLCDFCPQLNLVNYFFLRFRHNFYAKLFKLIQANKVEKASEELFNVYTNASSLCIVKKIIQQCGVNITIARCSSRGMEFKIKMLTGYIECLKSFKERIDNLELEQLIDASVETFESRLAEN